MHSAAAEKERKRSSLPLEELDETFLMWQSRYRHLDVQSSRRTGRTGDLSTGGCDVDYHSCDYARRTTSYQGVLGRCDREASACCSELQCSTIARTRTQPLKRFHSDCEASCVRPARLPGELTFCELEFGLSFDAS